MLDRLLPLTTLLMLSLILAGCSSTPPETSLPATTQSANLIKSPNDTRDYRYLELENGLRVVLISDPETDKSAASLAVYRGSFDEPTDRPGLAHFLEHMLFIGTEKYPEPDGYFSFVKSHGGSSNAYTATDHTNYFFDIKPEKFQEGLDRFAQFFISPLLDASYVDREKNAVHSEYQMQIKNDGWRGFMVQKVALNPEHPASRFNIGSLETFEDDVHGALLEFFESHYSANQMGLAVITNESLDNMEAWITPLFSQIENRNLAATSPSVPVYTASQLPMTLVNQTIKNQKSVSFSFPVPTLDPWYKSKPASYIGNMIGHEGERSLHSLLKSKGWINGLGAGSDRIDDNSSALSVSISLTDEGAKHIPEITDLLFDYITRLQNIKPEEWRYKEQALVAELGFRFKEKGSAMGTVNSLTPNLTRYPAEDLLVAPFLMEDFNPDLIESYLGMMTRDNVMVHIAGPDVETTDKEAWFDVPYSLSLNSISLVDADSSSLVMPARNPFLPENLDLLPDDNQGPQLALSDAGLEVWLDTDTEFGGPRAALNISFRSEGGLTSLGDVVRARLYSRLVTDSLNTLSYPALLAGLSYQIATPPRGFRISLGGYNDKQLVLLDEVLSRFMNLQIDPERFEVLKAETLKGLANFKSERPYQQAYTALQNLMISSSWSSDAQLSALQHLTPADLASWRDKKLAAFDVQALLHGNVDQALPAALADLLRKRIRLVDLEVIDPSVAELEETLRYELNIDHDDASMVLYLQDEDDSLEERAASALLAHLISPAYFSSLRTEQQLGYAVFANNTVLRHRGGLGFVIQSPVQGPDYLEQRTIEFIDSQKSALANMTEATFEQNKAGLMSVLLQKDKNLAGRSGRFWANLDRGNLTFDLRKQIAGKISALTKTDMETELASVRSRLDNRRLIIYSRGKFEGAPQKGTLVTNY